MPRSIQDRNFLAWDAFASTGKQGFTNDPHIVFQCTSAPESRPRWVKVDGDEASAQGMLLKASDEEVLSLFESSSELP